MSTAGDGGAGPSKPKPRPAPRKNVVRRSKEERDKIEAAENERRRVRAAAHAVDEAAAAARIKAQYGITTVGDRRNRDGQGRFGDRGGRGRRGRGGFMDHRDRANRPGAGRGEMSQVKTELGSSRDAVGDINMSQQDRKVKTEPELGRFHYESEDEDTDDRGWRDIEKFITIPDDDAEGYGDDDDDADAPRMIDMLPIRLGRKEHIDRVVGVNTDASSERAAEMLRKAKQGKEDLSLAAVIDEDSSTKTEATKAEARWRGVYASSDDEDLDASAIVKQEVDDIDPSAAANMSEDPQDAPHQRIPSRSNPAPEATTALAAQPVSPTASEAAQRQTKLGGGRQPRAPTVFDTDEARREHEIHVNDLEMMRQELGSVTLTGARNGEDSVMANHDDDDDDDDAAADDSSAKPVIRENKVYLFQLPPVLPDLLPLDPDASSTTNPIKPEPSSPTLTRARPAPPASSARSRQQAEPPSAAQADDPDAPPSQPANTGRNSAFAPGRAGKLRVHRSGRATLDWGGVALELGPGVSPHFLQNAYLTRMPGAAVDKDDEGGAGASVSGETMNFGQVRGKFVISPDWEKIVGNW